MILLNDHEILSNLNHHSVKLYLFESIDSTNDYLKNNILSDFDWNVCLAEMQTNGRGRLNRQWHSPYGKNIYLSMSRIFNVSANHLSGLSLVIGLAITNAIEKTLNNQHLVQVKWPNDILVNKQKIAGVLVEITRVKKDSCQIIIGIGVNVNMTDADQGKIDQPWTSLENISKKNYDRNILSAELINTIIFYLEKFSNLGLANFLDEWKNKDYLFHQPITLTSGTTTFSGIGVGINTEGYLLLELPDKSVRAFSSGECHLLK